MTCDRERTTKSPSVRTRPIRCLVDFRGLNELIEQVVRHAFDRARYSTVSVGAKLLVMLDREQREARLASLRDRHGSAQRIRDDVARFSGEIAGGVGRHFQIAVTAAKAAASGLGTTSVASPPRSLNAIASPTGWATNLRGEGRRVRRRAPERRHVQQHALSGWSRVSARAAGISQKERRRRSAPSARLEGAVHRHGHGRASVEDGLDDRPHFGYIT